MKPGTLTHTVAVLLSSMTSMFAQSAVPAKLAPAKVKATKTAGKTKESFLFSDPLSYAPSIAPSAASERYPWRKNIVTTVFWIGERPTANNPVPNHKSSWDGNWAKNYGGYDNPNRASRRNYAPAGFTPRQNPFYIALPYNDKSTMGHRPEASRVVPWFKEAYKGPAASVCKGRWVAIRKGNRVAYAQWEDAGPFRTDHWQYVFGTERPKPNLNKGAGLDVSPAVRDYLGMNDTDVTDWKFVEFDEVPRGPWAQFGDNNTFVQRQRATERQVAQRQGPAPATATR